MRAKPGDRLVIKSNRVGRSERVAEIVEVRGEHGKPPYLVRWTADGHEAIVYPGSDALVEHKRRRPPAGGKRRAD